MDIEEQKTKIIDWILIAKNENKWKKIEMMNILALSANKFQANDLIKIRFGTNIENDAEYKDYISFIDNLLEEDIYISYQLGDIIVKEITEYPIEILNGIKNNINFISVVSFRFINLLLKDETLLRTKGELSIRNGTLLSGYIAAYNIIFSNMHLNSIKYEDCMITSRVENELIKFGLLYRFEQHSNKHSYYRYYIPTFTLDIWKNRFKDISIFNNPVETKIGWG